MSQAPDGLRYSKSHEWIRAGDDNLFVVGITDHAQAALGDMVFVETPETGIKLEAGDPCAVVESVKAASDIYSPVSGKIVESNSNLVDSPELVNDDPYGKGWIFQICIDDEDEVNGLMDAEAYKAFCEEE